MSFLVGAGGGIGRYSPSQYNGSWLNSNTDSYPFFSTLGVRGDGGLACGTTTNSVYAAIGNLPAGLDAFNTPKWAYGIGYHDGTNWNQVFPSLFSGDPNFPLSSFGGYVRSILPDGGRLLVGGNWTDRRSNGKINSLATCSGSGSTWDCSDGNAFFDFNDIVYAIAKDFDGKYLVGGKLSDINGQPDLDILAKFDGVGVWSPFGANLPTPTPTAPPGSPVSTPGGATPGPLPAISWSGGVFSSRNPSAGVTIKLLDQDGRIVGTTTTDSLGKYSLTVQGKYGRHSLVAEYPGAVITFSSGHKYCEADGFSCQTDFFLRKAMVSIREGESRKRKQQILSIKTYIDNMYLYMAIPNISVKFSCKIRSTTVNGGVLTNESGKAQITIKPAVRGMKCKAEATLYGATVDDEITLNRVIK